MQIYKFLFSSYGLYWSSFFLFLEVKRSNIEIIFSYYSFKSRVGDLYVIIIKMSSNLSIGIYLVL